MALIWGQHLLITSLSKMRQLIEWILDASFHYDFWFHHHDFKFDIVCCQALLQVKANLCKCNNLGGYFLHRYQKPRARTNEVSSTERKNSICLARGFDINFRCKHCVLYNIHLLIRKQKKNWHFTDPYLIHLHRRDLSIYSSASCFSIWQD